MIMTGETRELSPAIFSTGGLMGAAKRSKLYFANWDCTNYDDLL